ncbi:DUF3426 domain-containing protein [Pseudomonas massiliensis]|uniref:DUF3426 domain-containing protein n=1 Tax=Pseudomonas massiliensis TaxID=522492 RepID=UPI00058EF0C9|nr:DUF3426 domain-containing protein [Pseudomonas massiliensis]
MTQSFVTQCPHCHTSFKVSHNQLSVARGAVRCGACKQVFNAARQLLEQSTGQGGTPSLTTPLKAPSLPDPDAWQREQAQFEELDLDRELARLERRPASSSTTNAPERAFSAQRDHGDDWLDEPFGSPDEHDEIDTLGAEHEDRHEPRLGSPSEALDDDEDPPQAPFSPLPSRAQSQVDPGRLAALREAPVSGMEAIQAAPLDQERARSEPRLREEPLLDLQEDPLRLEWEKPRASWGQRLIWSGLALLAAVALVAQYVVFHFDELARQESYRPWFVSLCPALGCTVPSRVDIHLIRSSNLVVRSHPTFAGALVVDAIIYNRAPFSQPFPLLELRFADINNKLIASRRFKPSEYLSGDLAGQSEMPPQIPIHIALDILDPGKRAVNYSLSFHSPE